MIIKSKIINIEEVQEFNPVELVKGKEVIKKYFETEPAGQEILNNIFVAYVNHKALGKILSIYVYNYMELFINENLEIVFSYIKTKDKWEELDKEQAQRELLKLYYRLGYHQQEQEQKKDLKSKYNLIGYLLKYKFNYKSFTGWEVKQGHIRFNFINKEGYKRSWDTDKRSIQEYFNYNNTNISKVLFDLN